VIFLCLPLTAWDSVLPLGPLISVFTIIRSNGGIYRISPTTLIYRFTAAGLTAKKKKGQITEFMSCNAHPIAIYQCPNSNNKTEHFSKTPPPPFFTHTNGFLMEK